MFGIRLLYQVDSEGGEDSAKNKKIYFEDPFLFWLFYCYTHHSLHYWRFARQSLHRRDVFNFLTEQVVFNHLTKIKNAHIFYWRDTAQKEEIDLVVSLPQNKILPVMLAKEDKKASRCQQILEKNGFRQGIIITEEEDFFASKKFVQISLLEFLLHFEEYADRSYSKT
jgi:predicted AAA+ superfamily ATPase